MQKIISVAIVVALLGLGMVLGYSFYVQPQEEVACTLEAKVCPDGSAVGREGPNCEFAACPVVEEESGDISDWKTYRNEEYGFEFMYPGELKEGVNFGINPGLSIEIDLPEIHESPEIQIYTTNLTILSAMSLEDYIDLSLENLGPGSVLQKGEYRPYEGGIGGLEAFVSESELDTIQIVVSDRYNLFSFHPARSGREVIDRILSTFKFTN